MRKRIATYSAWGIVAFCVIGVGGSFILAMRAHVATADIFEVVCAFLMYPIVGAVIVSQRPRNVIGRILLAIGLGTTITAFTSFYSDPHVGSIIRQFPPAAVVDWVGNVVWPLNLGLGMYLLLLFPSGHLPSPRWRWVGWVGALALTANAVSFALMPGPFSGETTINPFGVEALRGLLSVIVAGSNPLILLIAGAASFSVLWRFWRSREVERQQMKWFALGVSILAICVGGSLLWLPESSSVGFATGFAALPLTIGLAVLRSHLYDIDIIINRALVYGLLSATLAAIYFGLVIGSQSLTSALTGQRLGQQPIVIVLSTLLIAALFQPLRRRIQQVIDRRFYRRKFDAARTLATFGRTLRTEVEMERLCERLIMAVDETMQPAHVSLWLRGRATEGARRER